MAIKTITAKIDGQTYNLILNSSSGKYEAVITAPNKSSFAQPNSKFGIELTATDTAGNITTADRTHATLGSNLQLRVLEKTAPTGLIIYPTTGSTISNNKPAIICKLLDTDSGVNVGSINLKVDNTAVTGYTTKAVTDGIEIMYTPTSALVDGSHTVSIQGSDNDGNVSSIVTSSFKIDTIPPTLVVNSPVDNLITNNKSLTVAGTTNDAVSSPCAVTIKVNSGAAVTAEVQSNGTFSKAVTLIEGANTIVITSTDSAGKSTSVTRTVNIDTVAPVITSIELVPNPVDSGATYTIKVLAND